MLDYTFVTRLFWYCWSNVDVRISHWEAMKGHVCQCALLAHACLVSFSFALESLEGKQGKSVQEQRWTSAGGLETVSGALTASHGSHMRRHCSSPGELAPGQRAASAAPTRPPRLSLAYISEPSHAPQGGDDMRLAQSARQPPR